MANLDSRNVRVIALLAVLPLLFVGADASAQQEFQVEASVDRTVATLDDQILLEVVVRGVQRSAAPAAPARRSKRISMPTTVAARRASPSSTAR
jgi:hypothetical protein